MKRKGFKGILLLLSMLFALTGCSVSEATQHGMAVDTIQAEDVLLRVDFLNVGQADCALLSTNGHYMVIDGGNNGDADTILSYLEGQGVEKLDAVVGTHPHEDHIGSLDAIINHFDVDAVYMPKIMHTSKTFEDVLDAVANKGLKIKSPSPGDTIDFNGLEIEVLGPQREYKDFNNNSSVLKVNAGETAFLFTGDAEETAEKDILQADYDLQADVLKVGHHGSSTSSSQAFLQAVKPKYAVIITRRKKPCSGCKALVQRFTVPICRGILSAPQTGKILPSTVTASAAQRFMQMRQKTTPLRRRLFISRTRNRRNFIWKAVPPCRMRKTVFILRTERKPCPLAIRPAAPASHKQAGASHRRREKRSGRRCLLS